MYDVVIAGAGPAGSVAATVLARAGARVALIDRARFPRHKLCGDTLNPGVLAILTRLKLASMTDVCGLPLSGMSLIGEDGVTIEGRYPKGLIARAVTRSDFDWALVRDAERAGAHLFDDTLVTEPIVESSGDRAVVRGLWLKSNGFRRQIRAAVTIAADGRRSRIAFGLGLSRHPLRPRRWAVGVYADRVDGVSQCFGEMHVRPTWYLGVAPLPSGLTNVSFVKSAAGGDTELRDPLGLVKKIVSTDRVLRDRFS